MKATKERQEENKINIRKRNLFGHRPASASASNNIENSRITEVNQSSEPFELRSQKNMESTFGNKENEGESIYSGGIKRLEPIIFNGSTNIYLKDSLLKVKEREYISEGKNHFEEGEKENRIRIPTLEELEIKTRLKRGTRILEEDLAARNERNIDA